MHPASIGPFQVIRELGSGGMGVVYLGRDTRLDREVAIKALPSHLAQDADRLARFQREAKVLASLNHPGIGAIHGLEEANGHQYLILEYVEGETLLERMMRGAGGIPVDDALPLAKQIAEALEAAHEKGVIHRDLKPANLMLTPDGRVKVLDFGLARTEDGQASSSGIAAAGESPTIATPPRMHSPTIPGAIMGTAGYMSPEQARGKPIDKRSDIFSFGCVVYEMLTGVQPFRGDSAADSIGATLHKELDLTLLPPSTPISLVALLKRCTVKDKHHRLRDIGDARVEIEQLIANPENAELGSFRGAAAAPRRRSGAMVLLAAAGLMGVGALVAAVAMRSPPAITGASDRDQRVIRAALALPRGAVLDIGDRAVAVSPNGAQVVLAAMPNADTPVASLYLRDLSRLEFRPLAGTEGATYPFWSPDGRSIGFFADKKLKRIDVADGIVRTIADAPAGRGASWGSAGTIVFAPSAVGGLLTVSETGGTPQPATTPAKEGEGHRLPHMLPDGRRFLYYLQGVDGESVLAFDPETNQSKQILTSDAEAVFVEPGFLAFVRDENLMIQPFDLKRLELTGVPRPIAAGVARQVARRFINMGIAAGGTLVYQETERSASLRLAWMDPTGTQTPIAMDTLPLSEVGLTSDGRRAVAQFADERGDRQVAVLDLERGTRKLLDPANKPIALPIWSADAQSVICSTESGGIWQIARYSLVTGRTPDILLREPGFEYHPGSVTPDGSTLLFSRWNNRDKIGDLFTLDLTQPGPAKALMVTPESEYLPRLCRQGDLMAYLTGASSEDARSQVLSATTYPVPGSPVQVSLSPIRDDVSGWLSERELYWVDAKDRMWSATLTLKDGQLDVSPPKAMLGERPLEKNIRVLTFDQTRKRFLISIADQAQARPELIVVSDWRIGGPAEAESHK